MPSAPIHLKVAAGIAQRLGVSDTAQFLLGSVAPDSVNLNGFAPKDVRYMAHVRSTDISVWKQNVKELCAELLQGGYNADFVKGVATHLLTDIFWDELIQPQIFAVLSVVLKENGTVPNEDTLRQAKWQELYRYNNLVKNEEWYKDALKTLSTAQTCSYRNIDAGLMNDYKNYLVSDYADKQQNGTPLVICDEMINEVAEAVAGVVSQI